MSTLDTSVVLTIIFFRVSARTRLNALSVCGALKHPSQPSRKSSYHSTVECVHSVCLSPVWMESEEKGNLISRSRPVSVRHGDDDP